MPYTYGFGVNLKAANNKVGKHTLLNMESSQKFGTIIVPDRVLDGQKTQGYRLNLNFNNIEDEENFCNSVKKYLIGKGRRRLRLERWFMKIILVCRRL